MKKTIPVMVVGLIVAGAMLGNVLRHYEWNPTATIRFGELVEDQNRYAEELLGEIVLAPQAGHDGKFFFSQAMDPFYLEPDIHAVHLDRPAYRAQRMLYPTLAGAGGLASPVGTAWGLILVNLTAMAVGTAATALVAMRLGISRWFGLAFALNPGILAGLTIDGAGVVAFAALMAAVYLVMTERAGWAVLAMTLAALSREPMLIGVAGLTAYWFRSHRRIPGIFAVPWVATAGWWLYAHWRLDEGLSQDADALGLPFIGFFEAVGRWMEEADRLPDILLGFLLVLVSIGIVIRSIRKPSALAWAVAGFAVLGVLLSPLVWVRYFDSGRALAPVLTAYILLISADIGEKREEQTLAHSESNAHAGMSASRHANSEATLGGSEK